MNQEDQLQHVIDLIEKTGDKAVVLEKGRPAYVVIRLKDYEELILGKSGVRGLTEDELLDKINREIAVWKNDQEKVKELKDEYGDYDVLDSSQKKVPDMADRSWMHDDMDFGEEDDENKEESGEYGLDDDIFDSNSRDMDLPAFDRKDDDDFNIEKEMSMNIGGGKKRDEVPGFEEDRFYVEPVS